MTHFGHKRKGGSFLKRHATALLFSSLIALIPVDDLPGQPPHGFPRGGAPRRIVSLAPSVTETLFALGVGDRLVGVTTFCDYPPRARLIPKIGSFLNPSIEAVMAQRPDLVVGVLGGTNRQSIKQMRALGLRVLLLSVSSLEKILDSMEQLGKVVGREEAGKKLVLRIQEHIHRVRSAVSPVKPRRVLMLVGLRPLVAVGRGTFINELITLAGGKNIAAGALQSWPRLPIEYVVAQAPEVIIEGGMGSERGAPGERWGDLSSIPAVKEGRIFSYAADKILRPGPRIAEALEEIARLIHPECFFRSRPGENEERGCESSHP